METAIYIKVAAFKNPYLWWSIMARIDCNWIWLIVPLDLTVSHCTITGTGNSLNISSDHCVEFLPQLPAHCLILIGKTTSIQGAREDLELHWHHSTFLFPLLYLAVERFCLWYWKMLWSTPKYNLLHLSSEISLRSINITQKISLKTFQIWSLL